MQVNLMNDTIHPRVSKLRPGFSVGFITDLRLTRHLNLRFTPGLDFSWTFIDYKYYNMDEEGKRKEKKFNTPIKSIPFVVPVQLKWSADRESNYRPYVIGGVGIGYDFGTHVTQNVIPQPLTTFLQIGFGCDFYFSWFKLCPELKYQLGLQPNILKPSSDPNYDGIKFYTDAIESMRLHTISLVFNFE